MEQSRVRHPIAIQFRIKGTLKKAENLRGGQKQKLNLKKNVILSDSFSETNRDKDRYRDRDRVFFL